MRSARRLRLLISAYACEPGTGSEPGIGWNLATALAERHEVWVLTRANNRPPVERALARRPIPHLHFAYYDLPGWARWWKSGRHGVRLYYRLWQAGARSVACALLREHSFDAAQHLTFGQYWSPSFLADLDVPYIWGPVGGAEAFPRSLYGALGVRGMLVSEARRALPFWGERQAAVRRTARNAAVTLASTPETAARVRRMGSGRVELLNAVALSEADLRSIGTATRAREDSLRVLSAARFIGTKGIELGIRAFLAADVPHATYAVIGDGPERKRLERLVRHSGAGDRVRLPGAIPRRELLERYSEADVFLHLSPAESGGFVCLEAMAAGLPVISLNSGGPAVLVPDSAGIRIEPGGVEPVTDAVARALRSLARSVAFRHRCGEAGALYVRRAGTWNSRLERVDRLFHEVVGLS